MSETVTETPEPAPDAPLPPAETILPPQSDAPSEPGAGAEPPEPDPKPRRADRHVANLTARLATSNQEREAAERRAVAAEALLNVRQDGQEPPQAPRDTSADIEARATQLAADREFNRRLADIDTAGKADIGAEQWEAAKSIMSAMGATANRAFLEALAETENPAKIFAALSEDSDDLAKLMARPPAAMAAHLGRMDARMEAPTPKPVSNAPRPPAPIRAAAVEPTPDIYDERLSMREWVALREKSAPRHLGGRR